MSIYFCGGMFSITDPSLLASVLYAATVESESQIKMGFSGTGCDAGLQGYVFGTGMDKQCAQVITRVLEEIQEGHHITLNVYGYSRGGIAALLLAKQLGRITQDRLVIHLALWDPVPGNLLMTAMIDPLELCLANKAMDLRDCQSLKKVLVLYENQASWSVYCLAPLLALYPQHTELEEEVLIGQHSDSDGEFVMNGKITNGTPDGLASLSLFVQFRVGSFLLNHGTALLRGSAWTCSTGCYLTLYEQMLSTVAAKTSRAMHSAHPKVIVTVPGAKYLNHRHKALAGDVSLDPVALSVQETTGLFSWLKKTSKNHYCFYQSVQWLSMALLVLGMMDMTGVLAVIPLLSSLNALNLVFAPVLAVALSALWHYVAKPLLSWCVQNWVYPHYAIREFDEHQSIHCGVSV